MDTGKFEGHTPGPWHLVCRRYGFDVYGPLNTNDRLDNRVDAALMAAAPELLAEVERLRARVAELESELKAEKKWGELWYFVSDEAAPEFARIVEEWTPARWIGEAYKLMASKQA